MLLTALNLSRREPCRGSKLSDADLLLGLGGGNRQTRFPRSSALFSSQIHNNDVDAATPAGSRRQVPSVYYSER
jgi:hypothetical protein